MNIVKKAVLTLGVLMVMMTGTTLQAATPEESFRQNFPGVPLESITATDLPGLYEIVVGDRVFYYAPGPEYLISGEIITKEKKNLTQARNNELQTKKFKNLPLDKAVKIGSGPHTVIEITDPDCPFCRKASEYLAKRNDVTRYVFFYPIAELHPKAEAKVRYVLCAQDRAKAYEEAMTGKLDEMKFTPCDDAAAVELAKTHRETGQKVGVGNIGTPVFMIDGQVVKGADIPQIEKILGANQSASLSAQAANTDLKAALEKAKTLGKPLFIQYGRETCEHCRALKTYIKEGTVRIDKFIYVDLDCDNETARKQFEEHFKVDGNALPFVVIADSDGKQIASRSGSGKPEEYRALIEKANK
ncbi:MAG: thioredoxin fold domain-containing protein [Syntrophales bacterium]